MCRGASDQGRSVNDSSLSGLSASRSTWTPPRRSCSPAKATIRNSARARSSARFGNTCSTRSRRNCWPVNLSRERKSQSARTEINSSFNENDSTMKSD